LIGVTFLKTYDELLADARNVNDTKVYAQTLDRHCVAATDLERRDEHVFQAVGQIRARMVVGGLSDEVQHRCFASAACLSAS
jgi:hypothetical protein